jgi:hypothetical protein
MAAANKGSRHVPDAFAGCVGVPAGKHHTDGRGEIGDRGEEADGEMRQAEGLQHLRHPEADAVEPDHEVEIDQPQQQNAGVG